MSFEELGISNRLLTFSDGQKTIDMFTQIIGDLDQLDASLLGDQPYQPVALLLLDINMPHVSGIEAIKVIRQLYRDVN